MACPKIAQAAVLVGGAVLLWPGLAHAYSGDPALVDGGEQVSFLRVTVELVLVYVITTTLIRAITSTIDESSEKKQKQKQEQARKAAAQDDESKWHTAHIRSYTDLTAGARGQELKIRALSSAATFHIATAVKECKPRIRQLVQELCATASPSSSGRGHESISPQPAGGAGSLVCAIPRPKGADVDPVADVVYSVLMKRCMEGRPWVWSAMTQREHEALEMQLTEAVAEQAALREIEALLRAVHEDEAAEEAKHAQEIDNGVMWP